MVKILFLFLFIISCSGCMDGIERLQIIDENTDPELPGRFVRTAGGVNVEHCAIAGIIGFFVGLFVSHRWRK